MNPYSTYMQQQTVGWTRIDLLLALFDGAIERLLKAREELERGDALAATSLLARAQLIVAELAAGIDLRHGELPRNLLRLYTFAAQRIQLGKTENIDEALHILNILREGMQGIREEARTARTGRQDSPGEQRQQSADDRVIPDPPEKKVLRSRRKVLPIILACQDNHGSFHFAQPWFLHELAKTLLAISLTPP